MVIWMRKLSKKCQDWPKNVSPFLLTINIFISGFWLFSGWPGSFTGDSVMVLDQIKTGYLNDWHPIPYTLYYSVITLGGNLLALGSLIQIILLNFAVILLIRNVTRRSLNFAIVLNTLLLVTPYLGPYSITAWKDVPYLTFTILGIAELINRLSRGGGKSSKTLCIFYLTLGATMRHDGPLTLLVSTLLLVCISYFLSEKSSKKPNKRRLEIKSISKTLAWAALIAFAVQFVTPTMLNAKPKEAAMVSMAFLRDLAHVSKNDADFLDADEYNLIRSFSDETSWSFADDCLGPNGYLGPANFDFNKANLFSLEIFKIWIWHFFSGDALILLNARSCNLSSFSPPIIFDNKPNKQVLWTVCGAAQILPSDTAILPVQNDLLKNSLRGFLNTKVCGWSKYLGWPILFSISGLIAAVFLFIRTRRIEILLLGCIVLGRSLILYTFSVAQDFRYALLIHILAITMIAYAWLELWHRSSTPKN
jgi:hypothetical protein